MSVFSFPREVNEPAARIVAGFVALMSLAAIWTHSIWIPTLLAAGFLLRVGWGPRFSPLARFAVWAAPRLAPVAPVLGRPKRFAQGIGATVTLSVVALQALGHTPASNALLVILVVFATLESGFAFCFGCWLFGRFQIAGWISSDICEDCGPDARAHAP
ncbi:MAG: DUF4395 domain-containing protein [Myxococcaceae bacterium]